MVTLHRWVAAAAATLLLPAVLAAQAHSADSLPHPAATAPTAAPAPAHVEVHADPIASSRPGLTEYTGVVARGRVQLEGGYRLARQQGEHHHSIGEARFRFGIGGGRELRLDLNSFSIATHQGHEARGYEDAEVGVKTELSRSTSPWLPSTAAVLSSTVPSGSGAFGAGVWQPAAALSLGWSLPEHLGLLGTVRYAHLSDHGERAGELTGATTLSLPPLGPLHSHVEYALIVPLENRELKVHHVSGGYGYHVGHDVQLDMWAGVGVAGEDTEWLFGVGMSRRW